eukprot:11202254-Lingulodinium_polyedra.AAC.1
MGLPASKQVRFLFGDRRPVALPRFGASRGPLFGRRPARDLHPAGAPRRSRSVRARCSGGVDVWAPR